VRVRSPDLTSLAYQVRGLGRHGGSLDEQAMSAKEKIRLTTLASSSG
jgi:hypothetical protein